MRLEVNLRVQQHLKCRLVWSRSDRLIQIECVFSSSKVRDLKSLQPSCLSGLSGYVRAARCGSVSVGGLLVN